VVAPAFHHPMRLMRHVHGRRDHALDRARRRARL
jgi:hypothetical protein